MAQILSEICHYIFLLKAVTESKYEKLLIEYSNFKCFLIISRKNKKINDRKFLFFYLLLIRNT